MRYVEAAIEVARVLWGFPVVRLPIRTFAQALAAVLVADGAGLLDTDWVAALSVAGMAWLLSVLTNIGGGQGGRP